MKKIIKPQNKFVPVNVKDSSNQWGNVRYNAGTQKLKMEFTNSNMPVEYTYNGIDPKVIKAWERKGSAGTKNSSGKYFYNKIRMNYPYKITKRGGKK